MNLSQTEEGAPVKAAQIVHALRGQLAAHPPLGIDPDYVTAFFERRGAEITGMIAQALVEMGKARTKGAAVPTSEPVAPVMDAPPEDLGELTPWQGRKGPLLDPETVEKGQRVVTREGEHGVVARISRYTFVSHSFGEDGKPVRREERRPPFFDVRLDTGREVHSSSLVYAELTPPARVIPDPDLGDRTHRSPSEAWSAVVRRHEKIAYREGKAQRARKRSAIQGHLASVEKAREESLEAFTAFRAWREAWPNVPVKDFDARLYRELELSIGVTGLSPAEHVELAQVRSAPADWATRWSEGDAVRYSLPGEGRPGEEPRRRGRIAAIEGDLATFPGGDRIPLWLLHLDALAALEEPPETFDAPRYIVALAQEMNDGAHYPKRGAVARALKAYLGEGGVQVQTRVLSGSMVTQITLLAPEGRPWTAAERGALGRLLGGHRVGVSEVIIDPWAQEAKAWDPGMDYGPRRGGVAIPPENLKRFAGILAREMKTAGQDLTPLGERRLLALTAGEAAETNTSTPSVMPEAGAEGCIEMEVPVEGYGTVKVVCGQRGRRATWHNLHIGGTRYGFDGRRWARGMRPPQAVLDAVRARGVMSFEG